jgi:hypothetical protein
VSGPLRALAERLLPAFARSDVRLLSLLCAEDVVVVGTDAGERWEDRPSLLAAIEEMRALNLDARWGDDVVCGADWVAGTALYRLGDGTTLPVRVSLVFTAGRLAHGHFSVAQTG